MFKILKRVAVGPLLLAILFLMVQVMCDLYLPTLTANIVNKGVIAGDVGYIWSMGGVMLLISIFGFGAAIINAYYSAKVTFRLGQELRQDIFAKTTQFSNREYDQIGASSLITRNTNDVTQIQNLLEMGLRMLILSPMYLVGGIFLSFRLSPSLSMVFLWIVPILALAVFLLFRFARPMFVILQDKVDNLNRIFREGLTGVKIIRAFNKEDTEYNRYDEANKDYTSLSVRVFTLMSVMMPVMTLILGAASIAITWIGGHLVGQGQIEVGVIMAVITYSAQILMGLMMIGMIITFIPRGQASAKRINEVLDMELSVLDPAQPVPAPRVHSLSFEGVDYRYPGAEKRTLCAMNFSVKRGQTLAIIGGTGSGKTTLINLISRFYDVEAGAIKLGGVDVRDLRLHDLRSLISLAPQRAALFQGTVRDNMLLAKPDATDDEIWQALGMAAAADFIREEGGLDASVDKGGGNFSGGQKQRLSIARALLKPAGVYIFDDSFSALDFKTDAQIRAALNARNAGADENKAINIIVAQRISTVMHADRILVLNEGMMAGFGTHEELAATNQVYQEIILSQSEKDLAA